MLLIQVRCKESKAADIVFYFRVLATKQMTFVAEVNALSSGHQAHITVAFRFLRIYPGFRRSGDNKPLIFPRTEACWFFPRSAGKSWLSSQPRTHSRKPVRHTLSLPSGIRGPGPGFRRSAGHTVAGQRVANVCGLPVFAGMSWLSAQCGSQHLIAPGSAVLLCQSTPHPGLPKKHSLEVALKSLYSLLNPSPQFMSNIRTKPKTIR